MQSDLLIAWGEEKKKKSAKKKGGEKGSYQMGRK